MSSNEKTRGLLTTGYYSAPRKAHQAHNIAIKVSTSRQTVIMNIYMAIVVPLGRHPAHNMGALFFFSPARFVGANQNKKGSNNKTIEGKKISAGAPHTEKNDSSKRTFFHNGHGNNLRPLVAREQLPVVSYKRKAQRSQPQD